MIYANLIKCRQPDVTTAHGPTLTLPTELWVRILEFTLDGEDDERALKLSDLIRYALHRSPITFLFTAYHKLVVTHGTLDATRNSLPPLI